MINLESLEKVEKSKFGVISPNPFTGIIVFPTFRKP